MRKYLLAVSILSVVAPTIAHADCVYDENRLRARLLRVHDDREKIRNVNKEIAKAETARKAGSETECRNHVIRGFRLLETAQTVTPLGQTQPSAPNEPISPIGPIDGTVKQ